MDRTRIMQIVTVGALMGISTGATAQVKPQYQPLYNVLQTLSQHFTQKAEEADSQQKIESGQSTPEAEQEKADLLRQIQQQQAQLASQSGGRQAASAAAVNDAFGCTAQREAFEAALHRLSAGFDAAAWDDAKTAKQNYEMTNVCSPRTLPPLPPVPPQPPSCPSGRQCAVQ